MTALLLAVSLALAGQTTYPMNDAGITLTLPKGWEMTRWSDWDFKAKGGDGLLFNVSTTSYQVPVTPETVKAWAEQDASDMKKQGFSDAVVVSATVEQVHGRPTGRVQLALKPDDGRPLRAVYYGADFEGAGQVIHLYAIGLTRFDDRVKGTIDDVLDKLTLDKAPEKDAGPTVSTKAGFSATLPAGWRAPFPEEMDAVTALTAKVGEDKLNPDDCWVALLPPAVGDADLIVTCHTGLYLGPIDEHSAEGEEPGVRDHFFGKVTPPVPAGQAVPIGDRTGLYFRPSVEGVPPLRLAVAPYGGGEVMISWGLGSHLDGAGMDAAMMGMLPTVKFTGPDGGKPQIGLDRWLSYYLRYRTFSPMVLGPFVLMLGAFVGLLRLLRKKPAPQV